MYFPPTEILKIAYFLQPWARRAHRNPQNVCRRPSSTLSLSQWPELVFKHNNLSPKSWWGLPFSSKRMNVTRAKNMLQCLHTFTFTMTGNCLQREVACPLCEFETDILIHWSMWEGLKFNLTKLFNHLLVDNVGHLLVNHLNDLHVHIFSKSWQHISNKNIHPPNDGIIYPIFLTILTIFENFDNFAKLDFDEFFKIILPSKSRLWGQIFSLI